MVRIPAITEGTRTESTMPRWKMKRAKCTMSGYRGGCPSFATMFGNIWRRPLSASPKLDISSIQRLCLPSPDQRIHPPTAIATVASVQSTARACTAPCYRTTRVHDPSSACGERAGWGLSLAVPADHVNDDVGSAGGIEDVDLAVGSQFDHSHVRHGLTLHDVDVRSDWPRRTVGPNRQVRRHGGPGHGDVDNDRGGVRRNPDAPANLQREGRLTCRGEVSTGAVPRVEQPDRDDTDERAPGSPRRPIRIPARDVDDHIRRSHGVVDGQLAKRRRRAAEPHHDAIGNRLTGDKVDVRRGRTRRIRRIEREVAARGRVGDGDIEDHARYAPRRHAGGKSAAIERPGYLERCRLPFP